MRSALATALLGLLVMSVLAIPVFTQGKPVTMSGKVTCAMCDLKTEKECATVIVVKESGKDATYYLDEKASKANHDAVCNGGKEGTVTGIVSQKDGKKVITVSKVELKK